MKTNLYQKDRLRLARIGYFSKEHNGVAIEKASAFAIVYPEDNNEDKGYYNIFDENNMLPVFIRSRHFSNYTRDGESFGTKIYQVGGTMETGPCYIIESSKVFEDLPDIVTNDALKELVYRSEAFFPDRLHLYKEEPHSKRAKLFLKHVRDCKEYHELTEFFIRNDEIGIQYVKK